MKPEPRADAFYDVQGIRIEYISQAADQKYHLYLLGDEPGEHVVLYLYDPVRLNGMPVLEGSLNFDEPVVVTREGEADFTVRPGSECGG